VPHNSAENSAKPENKQQNKAEKEYPFSICWFSAKRIHFRVLSNRSTSAGLAV
jgi:hypothetical protein